MLLRDVVVKCELVSRAKLCLVSVLPDIVKDCPKIRNLPTIFLKSSENVGADSKLSKREHKFTNLVFSSQLL